MESRVLRHQIHKIYEGERIVQFRILRNQPEVQLENVLTLENVSRGGFGSTGLF